MVPVVASVLMGLAASAAPQSPWEQPAANLAEQVAEILGPSQARLTIRNQSSIPTDQIPAIRQLLIADLKAHGVTVSGSESANSIRVTLSENWMDGLWVAEVGEGSETRVAMEMVGLVHKIGAAGAAQEQISLRKEHYWSQGLVLPLLPFRNKYSPPVVAAVGTNSGLVVMDQDEISIYSIGFTGFHLEKGFEIPWRLPLTRDPRGILILSEDGNGFTAFGPRLECTGSYALGTDNSGKNGDWSIQCRGGDDPWPLSVTPAGATVNATANSAVPAKGFFNAARNYFTGVVVPASAVDLPPFYTSAAISRPNGAALLIGGIDGKVQMVTGGTLKPIAGTRDWGSDFAALHSGCGTGTQIIASSSGAAPADSLRAYELPAQEAIPASAPLAMDGTVTAMWTAPDGKSVFAVVRSAANEYEVDRVTASCN